ncbi:hypothetical protein [Oxobacter pfennigii]|nr:hypothetical protein [Oxobacter pfennigii]
MKRFIAELGIDFSEHLKQRMMELELRCVLTRDEDENRVDLKHVEHTYYNCNTNSEGNLDMNQKEYVYGQLVFTDDKLYFSESCTISNDVMQAPIVDVIYSSLNSESIVFNDGTHAKVIDDSNIDYIIDTLLTVFPQVSDEYIAIMSKYL